MVLRRTFSSPEPLPPESDFGLWGVRFRTPQHEKSLRDFSRTPNPSRVWDIGVRGGSCRPFPPPKEQSTESPGRGSHQIIRHAQSQYKHVLQELIGTKLYQPTNKSHKKRMLTNSPAKSTN